MPSSTPSSPVGPCTPFLTPSGGEPVSLGDNRVGGYVWSHSPKLMIDCVNGLRDDHRAEPSDQARP